MYESNESEESKGYADQLNIETPEQVDLTPVGTGPCTR